MEENFEWLPHRANEKKNKNNNNNNNSDDSYNNK